MHRTILWLLGALALAGCAGTDARAQQTPPPSITGIACAYNSTLPTVAAGNWGLVQCDANGKLILSGTITAGGTASSFGAAFPSSGTAIGLKSFSGSTMVPYLADTNGYALVDCATGCSGSDVPIAPVRSTAPESSHVFKASAGNFFDGYCTTGSVAGYCMLFDATAAPADGSVTPFAAISVAANSTASFNLATGHSMPFTTGLVGVFSSTGPFTKTSSATAFLSARVQ
jgi:hypothetical protein